MADTNLAKSNSTSQRRAQVATTATTQPIELTHGSLTGILNWKDIDRIWQNIARSTNDGWHLYRVNETKPGIVETTDDIQSSIATLYNYLREAHPRNYCGIVYADSITDPRIIRVFDPKYLTSMCNIYGNTPAPDWIFSRTDPARINDSKEASPKLQGYSLGKQLPAAPLHPQAADTLDARRMGCPLPLVHTARSLKRLSSGEILEIVSIDPGAVNDIEYLCECSGAQHLAITEGEYGYAFYVQKK